MGNQGMSYFHKGDQAVNIEFTETNIICTNMASMYSKHTVLGSCQICEILKKFIIKHATKLTNSKLTHILITVRQLLVTHAIPSVCIFLGIITMPIETITKLNDSLDFMSQNDVFCNKKVQVGKIRKRRNQKKIPTPKIEVGKKPKLTIRYLYHETYRKPNEQLFSQ